MPGVTAPSPSLFGVGVNSRSRTGRGDGGRLEERQYRGGRRRPHWPSPPGHQHRTPAPPRTSPRSFDPGKGASRSPPSRGSSFLSLLETHVRDEGGRMLPLGASLPPSGRLRARGQLLAWGNVIGLSSALCRHRESCRTRALNRPQAPEVVLLSLARRLFVEAGGLVPVTLSGDLETAFGLRSAHGGQGCLD